MGKTPTWRPPCGPTRCLRKATSKANRGTGYHLKSEYDQTIQDDGEVTRLDAGEAAIYTCRCEA